MTTACPTNWGIDMELQKLDFRNLKELSEMENRCFTKPWSASSLSFALSSEYVTVFGAFEEKQLVGYVILFVLFETSEIQNLAVEPAFRRRGIATKLLEEAIRTAKEKDAEHLSLEVRESNESAKNLYLKMGFQRVGKRQKYYSFPTEDALLMEKTL